MVRSVVAFFLFLIVPLQAQAASPPVVDVELVLAVDVSWSMDVEEQDLQREGYVNAIRHPDFMAAIKKGDWGRIAITYVEWAGDGLDRTLVPWTIIESEGDAYAIAKRLAAHVHLFDPAQEHPHVRQRH